MKYFDKIKKLTHRAIKRREKDTERNNRIELVEAKKFVRQQAQKGEGSCSILCQHKEVGEYFEHNGFLVEYRDVNIDWLLQGIEITIIWEEE